VHAGCLEFRGATLAAQAFGSTLAFSTAMCPAALRLRRECRSGRACGAHRAALRDGLCERDAGRAGCRIGHRDCAAGHPLSDAHPRPVDDNAYTTRGGPVRTALCHGGGLPDTLAHGDGRAGSAGPDGRLPPHGLAARWCPHAGRDPAHGHPRDWLCRPAHCAGSGGERGPAIHRQWGGSGESGLAAGRPRGWPDVRPPRRRGLDGRRNRRAFRDSARTGSGRRRARASAGHPHRAGGAVRWPRHARRTPRAALRVPAGGTRREPRPARADPGPRDGRGLDR